ncbi:MAG: hypothetical protein ACTSW7_01125 [Candidatus Thorarchaeota archaeon]|nr:hypothetical protein [Thermoplasmatales archaeon]
MEEATKLVSLNDLITLSNLVLIIAIQVVLGAVKVTLEKLKLLKKLPVEILLPYAPMLMGMAAAFIPGVIDAANLGTKIVFGVAIGGISGQIWKAVWKNSGDLLDGKLGEK